MIISDNLKMYVKKLRSSNLRPTKQRLKICQYLFDRDKTFHFTVETLNKKINKNRATKVSLATIYNTVEAFTNAGYLKEILTSKNKSYYDTNIKSHHHFYDEGSKELTDIHYSQIKLSKVPTPPKGKKIKNLEVVIRIQK
ncbi:MAG: transcriptional repressor [Candidatus Pelagibacter sp.]|nr:transcriptional repressor [Candidatus Pelagibacter sp.]OUW67357.1 MAG: transcriptional repressor [Candidatus Pelagibacter sp. TMED202]|tara:strand:- start:402 stop:821 length:420 start_codon:yes stop_codon:yes gene_type:complete